jgi:hypothetical protein
MTIFRTRIPKEISMAKGHWIKAPTKKSGPFRKAVGIKKVKKAQRKG